MRTVKNGRILKSKKLKIIHTSDVHGSFFTRDYVNNRPVKGGLSRVYAYVQNQRKRYSDRLLLIDGGDILQGSPVVYYNNFVSKNTTSLSAEIMNYMHYDVATLGNHDLETGKNVYEKWISECKFPIVSANILNEDTLVPYLKPYVICVKDGVRVAVMGMITQAVPNWLPRELWRGLRFAPMVAAAKYWMGVIKEKERPDLIVGLFHSGKEGGIVTDEYIENAALDVAREVPGFDIVCYGHDHLKNCEWVTNVEGKRVLCCAPVSMAVSVSEIDVLLEWDEHGNISKTVDGKITNVAHYNTEEVHNLQRFFKRSINNVSYYVGQEIGFFKNSISCEDSYFGSSAFVDLIHYLQMKITGAEVSFAAPLTFDARINEGPVHISDMFNLYKYENMLYMMRMKGFEIKSYLEMSYSLWTNRMKSREDHILLMDYLLAGGKRLGLVNLAYNFDSAAGINYIVDVTKPTGEKVTIESMADGTPFVMDKWYTVATNSYRGNGGGELMTRGAGIPHSELTDRLIYHSDKDLRDYFIDYIRSVELIDAKPLNNWRFIPEDWVSEASMRDRDVLFPNKRVANNNI